MNILLFKLILFEKMSVCCNNIRRATNSKKNMQYFIQCRSLNWMLVLSILTVKVDRKTKSTYVYWTKSIAPGARMHERSQILAKSQLRFCSNLRF